MRELASSKEISARAHATHEDEGSVVETAHTVTVGRDTVAKLHRLRTACVCECTCTCVYGCMHASCLTRPNAGVVSRNPRTSGWFVLRATCIVYILSRLSRATGYVAAYSRGPRQRADRFLFHLHNGEAGYSSAPGELNALHERRGYVGALAFQYFICITTPKQFSSNRQRIA